LTPEAVGKMEHSTEMQKGGVAKHERPLAK
jgi:hypothetical protein